MKVFSNTVYEIVSEIEMKMKKSQSMIEFSKFENEHAI